METDRFIDNAVMTGLHTLTLIHGKGTGVLRNAIHQHLRRHKMFVLSGWASMEKARPALPL